MTPNPLLQGTARQQRRLSRAANAYLTALVTTVGRAAPELKRWAS
jgi:hypothetical protein